MIPLIGATVPLVALFPSAGAQEWTTEPEFEIGNSPAAGATLWHVRQVRVNRDGSRIYVNEGRGYGSGVSRAPRVTVWSPDGSPLVEIGREGENRDLGVPLGIRLGRSGFWIRYAPLFMLYSDDGSLVEEVGHPGLHTGDVNVFAVLADRSFIGLTRVSRLYDRLGWGGGEPDLDDHLIHVSPSRDGWRRDTIADLDRTNLLFGLRARSGSGPIPTNHFAGQRFSDTDLFYLDAISRAVGIVTRNGDPGEVGLYEITIRGDTTWQRQMELPAVPIPAEVFEETVENAVESVTSEPVAPGNALARLPLDTLRRMARDALHLPSHLPPVTRAIATVSGEVWLLSTERSDTLVAWYSLPRGDVDNPPRRILLPVWYRLADVTRTHVWGIRTREDGAAQVLGRRLIPTAR